MLFMTAEWFLWQRSCWSVPVVARRLSLGRELPHHQCSGVPLAASRSFRTHFPMRRGQSVRGSSVDSESWECGPRDVASLVCPAMAERAGWRKALSHDPPSLRRLPGPHAAPLPRQVRPLLSMLFYRSSCPSACKSCRQRCRRDGQGCLCHRRLDTLDCRRQPLHLHPTLPAAAPTHCQRLLRRQSATAVGLGRRRCRHLGRHGRRHRFPRAPPSRPAASWTSSWTYGRTPSLHRSFTRETFFV